MEIVGRQTEQGALLALVDRIRTGHGGSLVVSGDAGMGKTALLRTLAANANDLDVRIVTGIPTEQSLPYAALYTLLLDRVNDRDVVAKDPVLATITGMNAVTTPPLEIAVASSVLSHFSALGESKPVLLIVDDLQWIDASSALALVFVARRLLADHVGVLFGLRTGDPNNKTKDEIDLRGFEEIRLDLLADDDSVEFLVANGVARAAATESARRAGGLPLALTELISELKLPTLHENRKEVNLPRMYLERIEALQPAAHRLCIAAAIDDDLHLVRDLLGHEFAIALDQAEAANVVLCSEGRLRFRHPLLRASALSSLSASEERALHAEFAGLLSDAQSNELNSDRIALHRGAAAIGADEEAAAALAVFAQRAYARGALREAIDALVRATELTNNRTLRATWTLEYAEIIYNGGDAPRALQIADELLRTHSDVSLSPKLETLVANASQWERDPQVTIERFRNEADNEIAVVGNPNRAAWLLAHASSMAFLSGDLRGGIHDGQRAIELADANGEFLAGLLARGNLMWTRFLSADLSADPDEQAIITTIMELASQSETIEGVTVGQAVVMTAVMQERWDVADRLLVDMSAVARRLGLRLSVVLFSMVQGALSWRRGRWQEGYVLATHDLEEGELPTVAKAWGRAAASSITATMGDETKTRELVAQVLAVAHPLRVPVVAAWAYASLGSLELGHGRPDLALPHFDRVAAIVKDMGLREPTFFLWQGDWIDSLIAMGLRAEAQAAIRDLGDVAELTGRSWARGVVARAEGQLATGRNAEMHFEQSLKEFTVLGMPFEIARTTFARGMHRRSEGRANSQQDLSEAGRMFRRLGALGWVARVEDVTGGSVAPNDRLNIQRVLSSAELRVALAVAASRTNKQVSSELYLSVKTVEFHLQSIYRKLGVKNRAEFVGLFNELLANQ
jgi:DNA-binding CsgD family transcriptional regulator/tetratricopeptide (TPR) repeat protein